MKIEIIEKAQIFNTIASHPLQSWAWGEARKKMGLEVLRIGEFSREKLINVFQLTLHPIPFTKFRIGYLPKSVFPSDNVLNYLIDYAKQNNIIFIKIEPDVLIENWKLKIVNPRLIKSPHPLFPEWTQILDLTKSEEELLKNMKPKTRYNIRLAQKKGVEVREMSDIDGFKIFSKLYFETCNRQKYYGHTEEYHRIVWETLGKDMSRILIAFYDDIPLAAYELFFFKNKLYYTYGGTSEEYRNLMASNFLMWEAIRLGKQLGAREFDMWGSLPPDYNQNNDWAGFTRFKEGYGTQFKQSIGSFDLVVFPLFYNLYNVSNKLRSIYLRLRF